MDDLDISIGQRLKLIREQKGLNQKDFGNLLNVLPQTYSRYEKGERGVTDEIKIQLYRMGVSLPWLLTGEGEMFVSQAKENLPETGEVKIPVLSQKVSCGPGKNWENEQNITEYISLSSLSPRLRYSRIYAFRVSGTSMLGAGIKDGDIVIFDANPDQELTDGIYVFSLDGDAYCKRLEFDRIANRIKIYSVRVADLEKAELLRTLDSTDEGFSERFQLFGRVFSWLHLNK